MTLLGCETEQTTAAAVEHDALTFVGWFEIVIGVGVAGLWATLLATHQVPEVAEGRRDIWFHIGAEILTAALLIAAGIAVLTLGSQAAAVVAAIGLGALAYTTINSPGYYADLGQWLTVAMFGLLTAATIATSVILVRSLPT